MLFQIKAYLKFLWHSKNEHAVHSPFVFLLLTKSWYVKKHKTEYSILSAYRNQLLSNSNSIEVTDFGAGSKVFKGTTRQIAAIAKNAGISKKRSELLYRIVHYFQPNTILEIGTSLGLATVAMATANPKAKITTLEGCSNTMQQCQLLLQKFEIQNVKCIASEFSDYFKSIDLMQKTFDMIYFDGNHSKIATINYFETLLPTITNNSVWIFDDIHWSLEMEEAWEIIKNHPQVTVTIDSFQWGFVFFRKEQEKQHFILRA